MSGLLPPIAPESRSGAPHTPLVQSVELVQIFSWSHFLQALPPQSMSDSLPFCTASVQLCG
jgi:hypothetical protein